MVGEYNEEYKGDIQSNLMYLEFIKNDLVTDRFSLMTTFGSEDEHIAKVNEEIRQNPDLSILIPYFNINAKALGILEAKINELNKSKEHISERLMHELEYLLD